MAESRLFTSVAKNINNPNRRLRAVTRRRFISNLAVGAAGAALALQGSGSAFAAGKDSGLITLDALLITYLSPAPGTEGQVHYAFLPDYSMTLGFRSLNNPDIALRARVAGEGEGIGQGVWQFASQRVDGALTVYPHAPENQRDGVIMNPPHLPENAAFYGLFRPILQVKGNARNASFRLVDPGGTFVATAKTLTDFFAADTANALKSQYVFNPTALLAPRYTLAAQTGTASGFKLTATAERKAPPDLTAKTTARIIGQTGFTSDAFKQAFAVGSNLEVTHYARQDSKGKILDVEADLQSDTPHFINFFWDRIFRTFVIVPDSPL